MRYSMVPKINSPLILKILNTSLSPYDLRNWIMIQLSRCIVYDIHTLRDAFNHG